MHLYIDLNEAKWLNQIWHGSLVTRVHFLSGRFSTPWLTLYTRIILMVVDTILVDIGYFGQQLHTSSVGDQFKHYSRQITRLLSLGPLFPRPVFICLCCGGLYPELNFEVLSHNTGINQSQQKRSNRNVRFCLVIRFRLSTAYTERRNNNALLTPYEILAYRCRSTSRDSKLLKTLV